jgi:hypothetical protein
MKLIVCCFRVLHCFAQRLPQEGRSHPIPRQQADKTIGRQPSWKWRYSNGEYRDSELECDFSNGVNLMASTETVSWNVTFQMLDQSDIEPLGRSMVLNVWKNINSSLFVI